jgi:hypothetical protein
MKIISVIVGVLVLTACSHRRNETIGQSKVIENTPPAQVEMSIAGRPTSDEDMTATEPVGVVVPAALDHLRQVIDVTMQTEPQLSDEHVAQALDAIADALAAMPEPSLASIDSIRADAAALRHMQGRSRTDARPVRRALDEAILSLRTIRGASGASDVDRAADAVNGVSPTRPITQQVGVMRDALCAVGSAVSVTADTGRFGCIEHTSAAASREH